ncbi:MAG: hypothetical protein MJE66_13035 [Proteobacteria bacterium]|nr:hypothetical protein [Pseudomonadota bacterium]
MSMRVLAISMLLMTVGATDCTFESSVPLGAPSAETFDPGLLGRWDCVDSNDPSARGVLVVHAFNDREYVVFVEEDAELYRAFSSRVDQSRFLSVQKLAFEPPGEYSIVGYELEPASLKFRLVELGPKEAKPTTPSALAEFARRGLASGSLYNEGSFACKRAGGESAP